MAIIVCPRCQVRLSVWPNQIDIVHDCDSGNLTLDQEDILDIHTRPRPLRQGLGNKLGGTRAFIEGGRTWDFTVRGVRKETHLTRQHSAYVDIQKQLAKNRAC